MGSTQFPFQKWQKIQNEIKMQTKRIMNSKHKKSGQTGSKKIPMILNCASFEISAYCIFQIIHHQDHPLFPQIKIYETHRLFLDCKKVFSPVSQQ